ncbi:MAG: terminase, partial [Quinella sp. 1Q5]|nr:terminase [Quinella sp. 1Q5]
MGNDWILGFLASADWETVALDGDNGKEILAQSMKDMGMKTPILPTVKEVILANAAFEQGLQAGRVCHMGQPSLAQAVTNCEKRAVGSNGGFGYRSLR